LSRPGDRAPASAGPGDAAPGKEAPLPSSKDRPPETSVLARRQPLSHGLRRDGPRPVSATPDRALQDLWVVRLRARDPEALRDVVHAFTERLGAMIGGILHDHDAVEDVLQETFAKAWLRIGSFQGDSSLYTWLYRVAVNGCKDHLKRRRRRPVRRLDEESTADLPAAAPAPLEGIERREARVRVRTAIAALPPKFRAVLSLREIEGMAYHEIAEVLGLSLGTVESRLFRARRRLRDLLSADVPAEVVTSGDPSGDAGAKAADSAAPFPLPKNDPRSRW
jgi:RNA polymerase sigma-70 factor (ECF subfamily)